VADVKSFEDGKVEASHIDWFRSIERGYIEGVKGRDGNGWRDPRIGNEDLSAKAKGI
jgi:hypothetical protein